MEIGISERASMVFEKKNNETDKLRKEYESKQEHLQKLVGQLTVEIDWLKKNLALNEPLEARKVMVERNHAEINVKRQADLLSVNRTSIYRHRKEHCESEENVQIMHRIDEIYMEHPYFGYRCMTRFLRDQGFEKLALKRLITSRKGWFTWRNPTENPYILRSERKRIIESYYNEVAFALSNT
ncbi:hypothetical protein [Paenibacillus larvae]